MKIMDLCKIMDYDPTIQIDWIEDTEKIRLLNQTFILTKEVCTLMEKILQSMISSPELMGKEKLHNHFIIAQYGKGKSRFMLTLMNLLKFGNSEINKNLLSRIQHHSTLSTLVEKVISRNNVIAYANAVDFRNFDFAYVIYQSLKRNESVQKRNLLKKVYKYDLLINQINRQKEQIRNFEFKFTEITKMSLGEAINKLRHLDAKCYDIVRQSLEKILGVKIHDEISISEMIKDISEELKEEDLYLTIFIDELTTYIKNCKVRRDSVYADLQELAESIERYGNGRITLIASLHKSISETFEDYNISDTEIQKLMGRFADHADLANFSFEQIISSIIKTKITNDRIFYEKDPKSVRIIKTLHKQFEFKAKNFMEYYPFHPATIYYLSYISEYSNATRTALSYVLQVLKRKVNEEILTEEGKMNLILPDTLWDSFVEPIRERKPTLPIAVEDTFELGVSSTARRIMKLLAVARAAHDISVGLSAGLGLQEIQQYLFLEESLVNKARDELECSRYIQVLGDKILLDPEGIPDITTDINEVKAKISLDNIYSWLSKKIRDYIQPKEKIIWKREWAQIYYSILQYNAIKEDVSKFNAYDCVILIIEKQKYEELSKLLNDTNSYSDNTNVGLIILNKRVDIELCKNVYGYEELKKNIKDNPAKKRAIEKGYGQYIKRFDKFLEELLDLDNIEIIYNSEKLDIDEYNERNYLHYDITSISDLIECLAIDIIEHRYYLFPKLSHENPISNRINWLKQIVHQFSPSKEINLKKMQGEGRNVIKAHFWKLDLIRNKPGTKDIIEPTIPADDKDPTSWEIVQKLQELAASNKDSLKHPLTKFYETYVRPPYGLNDILIMLYILWYGWKFNFVIYIGNKEYKFDENADELVIDLRNALSNLQGKNVYLVQPEKVDKQLSMFVVSIAKSVLNKDINVENYLELKHTYEMVSNRLYEILNDIKQFLDTEIERISTYDIKPLMDLLSAEKKIVNKAIDEVNKEIEPQTFFENTIREIGKIFWKLNANPSEREIDKFLKWLSDRHIELRSIFNEIDGILRVLNTLDETLEIEQTLKESCYTVFRKLSAPISRDDLEKQIKEHLEPKKDNFIDEYTKLHEQLSERYFRLLSILDKSLTAQILEELTKIDINDTFTHENLKQEWISKLNICSNLDMNGHILCRNCGKKLIELKNNLKIAEALQDEIELSMSRYVSYWVNKLVNIKKELQKNLDINNDKDVQKFKNFFIILDKIKGILESKKSLENFLKAEYLDTIKTSIHLLTSLYQKSSTSKELLISVSKLLTEITNKTKEELKASSSEVIIEPQKLRDVINRQFDEHIKRLKDKHGKFKLILW